MRGAARPGRAALVFAVLGAVLAGAGCTPTCDQVCAELVACDNLETWRMTRSECEASCNAQHDLLATWTDEQLRDAFDEELRCLGSSTCEEIAAGVCYDADVWSYEAR